MVESCEVERRIRCMLKGIDGDSGAPEYDSSMVIDKHIGPRTSFWT
jgi:hypothetical protein